jgi:beta-glucosidase
MESAIDRLSLKEQIAQMLVVRASGHLFDRQIQYPIWEPPQAKLQHWVADLGVGGVILLGGSAAEISLKCQKLQNWAKIPLLMAADIEEGVGQRFAGATWFPPPMALSAIAKSNPILAVQLAEKMGAITAQEALQIGLNWVLAPIVDVNNNPQNPVINVRAFGEDPATVIELTSAFIKGTQKHSVLTTAKHFPGHGDTAVDSHLDLPVLPHSATRLSEIELPPFQAAIAAGVDGVMSAHLVIQAWDEQLPATLSRRILTEELREKLGFSGLIVTDALVMGAIANRYGANEAPVMALEAGADILLMPLDPPGAIAAIESAVNSGRITPERIKASVARIWQAKGKLSQNNAQLSDLALPESEAVAREILHASQSVHHSVPLSVATPGTKLRNLIVVDDALTIDYLNLQAPAITYPKQRGYQLEIVDRHTPKTLDLDSPSDYSATLLQLFIRGNPFRGSAGLTPMAQTWFKHLLERQELQALIIYGSPYLVEQFLPHLPAEIPCVFSYGQMPTAQAIALETLLG